MVYYPLMHKIIHPKKKPLIPSLSIMVVQYVEFQNLLQVLLSNNLMHPCPHFLHLHIPKQVLPPELFFYCESMLQNLTHAFCINRLFIRIRIYFIASAHHTYLFFIFQNECMASLVFLFNFRTKKLQSLNKLELLTLFKFFCFHKVSFCLFIFYFYYC